MSNLTSTPTGARPRLKTKTQRVPRVRVGRAVMCHSELIPGDVERTMKDAENVYVPVVLDEVGDAVVSVEQDPHMARRSCLAIADLGKSGEKLRPIKDSLDRATCGSRVICGDVLENVLEPAFRFVGPDYFCHERMRRSISSFEIVRFASESVRPRSTIT